MNFNPLTASPEDRARRYSWALQKPRRDPGEAPYVLPAGPPRVRAKLDDETQAHIVRLLSVGAYSRGEIARSCGVTDEQVRTVQGRVRRGVADLPIRRSHRLTAEEVLEIQGAYSPDSGVSLRALAAQYGVGRKSILSALQGVRA